jgi:hypothetical protein
LILAQGISFRYFNTNIPFWGDENNLYFLNNLVAGDWGLVTGDTMKGFWIVVVNSNLKSKI